MRTIIQSITILSTVFASFACQSLESTEAETVELRGGAVLTPAEGTSLDLDELDAREGYGTTLTESDGMRWFVRVERVEADTLEELGLEATAAADDTSLYIGIAESDGGDDCRVYMPLRERAFVLASRPAGDMGCPESFDEVADWLPAVEADEDDASALRAFGDVVGTFNGITAYSNGSLATVTYQYNSVGMMWQCVEYVNRYYFQKLAHKNLIHTGNANQYYASASSKDLFAYANGTTTVAPAVGDMLVSNGGSSGHIAIIREVGANYVKVIHQNWANSSSDNSKQLTLSVSGGKYTIGGFSANYPVIGWLRRKCTPSISSVSPTSAALNQSKQFTGFGSCLSTTTTAPFIPECNGLTVNSRTSNSVVFTCTPKWTTGVKAGMIKHAPGGVVLKNFSVSVY